MTSDNLNHFVYFELNFKASMVFFYWILKIHFDEHHLTEIYPWNSHLSLVLSNLKHPSFITITHIRHDYYGSIHLSLPGKTEHNYKHADNTILLYSVVQIYIVLISQSFIIFNISNVFRIDFRNIHIWYKMKR